MPEIIDLPTPPPIPAAESIATSELTLVNDLLERRIADHKTRFRAFWHNAQANPDEIVAAMGTNAALWLAAAAESAGHIGRLAAIVGKTIDDFIAPEYYAPPRAFIIAQDGSVTIEPAPEPEPEPEPTP